MMMENKEPENTHIPNEFFLESKVILLSSNETVPESLSEKTLSFQISELKEDAINSIITSLESLGSEYEELTIQDKKEVLSFIRHNKQDKNSIDYATFLQICVIWKSENPNKEDWAKSQL
jgi:hypothetical protein